MCGITGIYSFKGGNGIDQSLLRSMTKVLSYRGPDSEGYYTDSYVGLGHRRLSIIDLSEKGKQPMCNENGDIWIVFNGEIYNFMDLREDLEKRGHKFRSNTDTEVMIHAYEEYGEKCVNFFRGMFTFAIWDNRDKESKRLFIARDRVGKKPLFYYYDKNKFVFASELKSIIEDESIKREIDLEALSLYLSYGYVPAPRSIFKNIHKILPGHYLVCEDGKIRIKKYWDLRYKETNFSEEHYKKLILKELEEAVKIRLISDVPLGAFLSGGIDSSAVVAMMSKLTDKSVKTFTIGFEEQEFDESRYARIVAEKFETDHKEMIVKPDAIKMLPKLVWHYNEPYADSSALPSYYVAKMTRKYVTVALNGDGGDESFAGYERYAQNKMFGYYDIMPLPIRKMICKTANMLPEPKMHKSNYRKLRRFFELSSLSRFDRYVQFMLTCDRKTKMDIAANKLKSVKIDESMTIKNELQKDNASDFLNKMMYADVKRYLPDDLLVKMDIATMANSLEARSPFLDHELMELAASVPPRLKLKGMTKKYILKKALQNTLPKEILHRRKMGFGVPLVNWFRGDLQEFAYNSLMGNNAFISSYLRTEGIKDILNKHKSKRKDNSAIIWNLLWLEMWGRIYVQRRGLSKVY